MGDIKVVLDADSLSQYMEEFSKELNRDLQKGIAGLAKAVHAHIVEDAQTLHSSREKYLEDLSEPEQIDDVLWVITLKESSVYIEDGIPTPYDMKPGLLKDGKTGKNGKYRIVPMDQGKTPTQMSPRTAGYEQNMVNKVMSELKKRGIPYKKLETESAIGRKTGNVIQKPIQGRGTPLHKNLNLDSYVPGKGNTAQLAKVNIYQEFNHKTNRIERKITTFRTVTEHGQEEKWIHPPIEPLDAFLKAEEFALREWEDKWLPAILGKYQR